MCTERIERAHFPACNVIQIRMEKKGLKSSNSKNPVLCFKPDQECNQRDEKNRMHELPVPEEIEKLIPDLMAQVIIYGDKCRVQDIVQIRKH
jgi:hypothetical protein